MAYFRDIDIFPESRLEQGDLRLLFTQPITYIVYHCIKKLKITIDGKIAKINIRVVAVPREYDGNVWDGCTDVDVAGDLIAILDLDIVARNILLLDLMVSGIRRVFDHFELDISPIDAMRLEIVNSGFDINERIAGIRNESRATIDLRLRWAGHDPFTWLHVSIKKGGALRVDLPVCRAYPIPEDVKYNFSGMEISADGTLRLLFKYVNDSWCFLGYRAYEPVDNKFERNYLKSRELVEITIPAQLLNFDN